MDQQTRQALKKDKFVATTTQSLEWASEHRQSVIRSGGIAVVIVVLLVVSAVVYSKRSEAASVAFGSAMQTYQAPVLTSDQPAPAGVTAYQSGAQRAKAAYDQFSAVGQKYGMTPDGRNAEYFAGLSAMDAGMNAQAETALKQVAGSWDSSLASLAKLALAQLYQNSGRDSEAVDLYNDLAKKPTSTVPSGLAQLQLADLYQSEGKTDQAKEIYASLKDKDAKGAAGAIAAQKLNPTASPQMGPQ